MDSIPCALVSYTSGDIEVDPSSPTSEDHDIRAVVSATSAEAMLERGEHVSDHGSRPNEGEFSDAKPLSPTETQVSSPPLYIS